MWLHLKKTQVQQDRINPPDSGEGELVHWKRVKVAGVANIENHQLNFKVLLDIRPRLLQVFSDEPERLESKKIAETLINNMCRFSFKPKESIFHLIATTSERTEWIVDDAIHISGLLHRLIEEGVMSEMEQAPYPPGTISIVQKLMKDAERNYNLMRQWHVDAVTRGSPVYGLHFSTATWEVLGRQLSNLLYNRQVIADFSLFFEYSKAYSEMTKKAMSFGMLSAREINSNPEADNVWSFFRFNYEIAQEIWKRLEKWHHGVNSFLASRQE